MPGSAIGTKLNPPEEVVWFAQQLAIIKGQAGFKFQLRATTGEISIEAVIRRHLQNALQELNVSKN